MKIEIDAQELVALLDYIKQSEAVEVTAKSLADALNRKNQRDKAISPQY